MGENSRTLESINETLRGILDEMRMARRERTVERTQKPPTVYVEKGEEIAEHDKHETPNRHP